ncbi:hypothetical protein JY651_42490 [Pyxidicoccus parkwayensis]|uniref:Uncharacterized protein n=1 Tax=Pyxidicoccus parkwayensis TaxID=2813578 RepID=A0ABX7NWH6_9BACT|nr:hypothetical protein [Pyxidicoccus parkwaysis]QSQ21754.1 hypothetical protein JY651_42490 [Pyxidicoccus parkwaysis]
MKLAKMAMMLPMLALAPAVAQAGTKCTSPATVDVTNRWARGALGSVRNTADTVSNIYCIVYSYGYAFCSARDAAGVTGSCGTSDPGYINTLQAMTQDSYVYFTWDTAGTCNYMVVENMSCLDPKSH